MRVVNAKLFDLLKNRAGTFVTGWMITRADGEVFGFSEFDREFVYDGVTYHPTNGIAGDAVETGNDFSTNNTSARVLFNDDITEHDVRAGLFDFAEIKSFWIDPYNVEAGIVPIQRGNIGQVKLVNNEWTAEFRSLLDLMQLPFGRQYSLECPVKLGDSQCGATMTPPGWTTATTFVSKVSGDARIGGIVKPSVYNGFWYQCVDGTHETQLHFSRGTTYAGLGPDIFAGSGINPFAGMGWQGYIYAQLFEAQLASYNPPGVDNITSITVKGGKTGATEPAWPTVAGETVVDGEVTWKAIPARIVKGVVTSLRTRSQFVDMGRSESAQTFQYGWMKWVTGLNAGKVVEIRNHTGSQITMVEVMPYPIAVGDEYEISWGCAKTRAACVNKFDNMLNFRGCPDMPTEDRALQTPNFSTNNETFNNWTDSGGGGKK